MVGRGVDAHADPPVAQIPEDPVAACQQAHYAVERHRAPDIDIHHRESGDPVKRVLVDAPQCLAPGLYDREAGELGAADRRVDRGQMSAHPVAVDGVGDRAAALPARLGDAQVADQQGTGECGSGEQIRQIYRTRPTFATSFRAAIGLFCFKEGFA